MRGIIVLFLLMPFNSFAKPVPDCYDAISSNYHEVVVCPKSKRITVSILRDPARPGDNSGRGLVKNAEIPKKSFKYARATVDDEVDKLFKRAKKYGEHQERCHINNKQGVYLRVSVNIARIKEVRTTSGKIVDVLEESHVCEHSKHHTLKNLHFKLQTLVTVYTR